MVLRVVFILFVSMLGAAQAVASSDQSAEQIENNPQKSSNPENETKQNNQNLDTASAFKNSIANGVGNVAEWVDDFFADPNYLDEQSDVRLDLKQSVTVIESLPDEYRTRLSARVTLPNLDQRLSLTFEGDGDEVDKQSPKDNIFKSVEQTGDRSTVGLQYFDAHKDQYDHRVKFGYQFGRSSYYVGGRIRAQKDWQNQWQFRLSQRARWYKQYGWENLTLADLNYSINEKDLLQQRFEIYWAEPDKRTQGIRYALTTSYVKSLTDLSAWRFSWRSEFQSKPVERWYASKLSINYRRKVWQDWIYFDVTPFVTWEEVNNWRDNYGIELSFSFLIDDTH